MSALDYIPGSEEERVRLAEAVRLKDAAEEEERIRNLPEPEEAPPPVPGLSAAERAELERLRATQLSNSEREELNRLRSGNTPYQEK